jgi:hypothetical protein
MHDGLCYDGYAAAGRDNHVKIAAVIAERKKKKSKTIT